MWHEREWLRLRRFDNFPDIDTQSVTQQRHFVDKANVDEAERILDEFGKLGDFWRADRHHFINARLVQEAAQAGRFWRRATDNLGCIFDRIARIAGVDSLGSKH